MKDFNISEAIMELEELKKDYVAFSRAYDVVRLRINESSEIDRLLKLHNWSGADAVTGSLELSIHIILKNIKEYEELIQENTGSGMVN